MKITIFGDSIAKGLRLDENDLSIKKLETSFASLLENKGYEVQNISMFGQTLRRAEDKKIFDKYISNLNQTEENIAIIELGGNDADFNWEIVQNSPEESHLSKTSPDEFVKILTNVITKLKSAGVKVFVCSLFPISSARYFDNILTKKYNSKNILKFLKGDKGNLYRYQESYNFLLTKSVVKTNVNLIDYRSKLLLKIDFLEYLSEDGIHPNEKGQKFIFDEIARKIEKS